MNFFFWHMSYLMGSLLFGIEFGGLGGSGLGERKPGSSRTGTGSSSSILGGGGGDGEEFVDDALGLVNDVVHLTHELQRSLLEPRCGSAPQEGGA